MIKIYGLFVFVLMAQPCPARDFIVQFEDENYKETRASFSYLPVIYHSIQISSNAGSKLLVLTGDDYHYRRWLRQYIAQDMAFIVKVPEDQTDQFVKNSVFNIDVTKLHPIDMELYKKGEQKNSQIKDDLSQMKKIDKSMSALTLGSRSKRMKDPAIRDKNRSSKKRIGQDKKSAAAKSAAQKKQADLEKARKDAEKQKKVQAKDREKALEDQAELQRLKNEQILKALEEQKSIEEQRAREQAEIFKALAEQRARDEQLRRQQLEQRYQELKQRLLQDERIRGLELNARNREIQNRWLELQNSPSL